MADQSFTKTRDAGIFKKGNRYYASYRDRDGRQRMRSCQTLAEARVVRATMIAKRNRASSLDQTDLTFAEYAAEWMETFRGRTSRGIQPETLAEYRRELERFAIPHFATTRLIDVTTRDVKQLVVKLEAKGFAPNTVRLAIAPVRALFATAREDGLLEHNPVSGVRLATRAAASASDEDQEEQAKALTEIQLADLLDCVADEWRAFVAFVAQTGLRISEAVAVRRSDLDFTEGRLNVRRRYRLGRYAPPKSKYGRRSIPLTKAMRTELRERCAGLPTDALVFANRAGQPLDASNLAERVLKPAARTAGVPWASWHTLRHTCGSLLFRHGANAKQVQVWLGHHSPAFTLAVYVHILPEDAPDPQFLETLAPLRHTPRAAA